MTNPLKVRIFPTLVIGLTCSIASCGSARNTTEDALPEAVPVSAPPRPMLGGPIVAKPYAVIYKTNSDLDSHVIIGYDRATGTIVSYPAPTDVDLNSEPLHLVDGWLLDRRGGIGANTAFLRWTYAEYMKFKTVPSLAEIRDAILPDARVTEFKRLDMTATEAQRDTTAVNNIIKSFTVK